MEFRDVFIVDARRTPQAKAGTELKDVPVPHLGVGLVRSMLDKLGVPSNEVDEVIFGNIGAPAKYANVSRVIALQSGLDITTSAYTVHRNCASGLEALSQGFLKIASGEAETIIAGGIESMTQMPLIFSKEMTNLFLKLMRSKTVSDKLKVLSSFRPPHLSPVVALEQGLTDPFCGLNMGQTAEVISRDFDITRQEQDEYALNSHVKAIKAIEDGRFNDEIVPILYGKNLDKILVHDSGPRAASSLEKLGKLRPYFDRKSGTVTVGNACPITDGGSSLVLMSAQSVEKYGVKPLAKIKNISFGGLDPKRMGMGPLVAIDKSLRKTGMEMSDFDLVEINEAFAAQVIGVQRALDDKKQAQRYGVDRVIGAVPEEKLNVNGGAIALGHPVGSSGSRIVVTALHELIKRKGKYAMTSLCIGGGKVVLV